MVKHSNRYEGERPNFPSSHGVCTKLKLIILCTLAFINTSPFAMTPWVPCCEFTRHLLFVFALYLLVHLAWLLGKNKWYSSRPSCCWKRTLTICSKHSESIQPCSKGQAVARSSWNLLGRWSLFRRCKEFNLESSRCQLFGSLVNKRSTSG